MHSAAGGVGSMLLQMLKVCGYKPIVAVVGSSHKRDVCMKLGADRVIVKDRQAKGSRSWWKEAEEFSPDGYAAIFDANGAETLSDSYDHLSRCGSLITYGFHTNLPRKSSFLSPWHWIRMIFELLKLPRFDPMTMVLESRTVAGFNLSFFADEHELIQSYMAQIVGWVEDGSISLSNGGLGLLQVMPLSDIRKAHELLQSGGTTGKIVIRTKA